MSDTDEEDNEKHDPSAVEPEQDNGEKSLDELRDGVISQIADTQDADILFYNGPIARPFDEHVINELAMRRKRPNVVLLLVTTGGDPDPAYRMARALQDSYRHVTCFVSGYCKSAGTLMALGAHEIVLSDHGELGPLDVQLSKKDDLRGMQSGLTVMTALTALQEKAFSSFEEFFLGIEARSNGSITVKTAADISTDLVSGLYAPIFSQVDPMHVGEASRAMLIGLQYGRRLAQRSQNCTDENLHKIATSYPSHGFVIDRGEAESLFENARAPNQLESLLGQLLDVTDGYDSRRPSQDVLGDGPFAFLNAQLEDNTHEQDENTQNSAQNQHQQTDEFENEQRDSEFTDSGAGESAEPSAGERNPGD